MIFQVKSVIVFSLLFSLLCSSTCFATWYQGNAQRNIEGADFDEVRTQTIKRAIANAAMQSHSFIQAEDIVLDGLLQSSKTLLRSEGQIRRVEIVSETIDGDTLSVFVKVDVSPILNCLQDPYAKSLLITQIPLVNPNQAAHGALFDIGIQTSKRFEMQLKSQPRVFVNSMINKAFVPYDSFGGVDDHYLEEVGRYLASEHDSQFILFGSIRDISLFEQVKEEFLSDDVLLRRNFTLKLYLYDAVRGNILLQKDYHGEANWKYAQNYKVDTNNSLFWRTDYGRSVLHTINSAVTDINETLSCQESLPRIIHNADGQLVINIGEKQGVKLGDEFSLVNYRLLNGANGKVRPLLSTDYTSTLNVIQVDNRSAVLTSNSLAVIDDSQLFNLVSPKSLF